MMEIIRKFFGFKTNAERKKEEYERQRQVNIQKTLTLMKKVETDFSSKAMKEKANEKKQKEIVSNVKANEKIDEFFKQKKIETGLDRQEFIKHSLKSDNVADRNVFLTEFKKIALEDNESIERRNNQNNNDLLLGVAAIAVLDSMIDSPIESTIPHSAPDPIPDLDNSANNQGVNHSDNTYDSGYLSTSNDSTSYDSSSYDNSSYDSSSGGDW